MRDLSDWIRPFTPPGFSFPSLPPLPLLSTLLREDEPTVGDCTDADREGSAEAARRGAVCATRLK